MSDYTFRFQSDSEYNFRVNSDYNFQPSSDYNFQPSSEYNFQPNTSYAAEANSEYQFKTSSNYSFHDQFSSHSSSTSDSEENQDGGDDNIESGLYVLPRYLTTKRTSGMKWNVVQFQKSWYQPNAGVFDTLNSLIKLDSIEKDFTRSATLNAKLLIEELFKPEKQLLRKSQKGGIAGGSKYVRDSIFFKFNLDTEGIYGGAFLAFKAGKRELSNYIVLYELFYPKYHFLSVPLFAIIDYCGYQVSCVGLLPLKDEGGLCYGSSDGGKTVFKSNIISKEIEELAGVLNLAPHIVTESGDIVISHCIDIEVHQGTDDKFYVLDTARLMPPEYPLPSNTRSIFYYYLRPEFVSNYHIPLCPDALSGFLKWDPQKNILNNNVKQATEYLIGVVAPNVAAELDFKILYTAYDCYVEFSLHKQLNFEYKLSLVYYPFRPTEVDLNISDFLHSRGINLRHLGLVYQHLKSSYWQKKILNYIFARSAKNILKILWKKTLEEMVGVTAHAVNRATIEFLNLLLGTSDETVSFWKDEFSATIYNSYFSKAFSAKKHMIETNFSFIEHRDPQIMLVYLRTFFGMSFYKNGYEAIDRHGLPEFKQISDGSLNPEIPTLCKMNFSGMNYDMEKFGAIIHYLDRTHEGFSFKLREGSKEYQAKFLIAANHFWETSIVKMLSFQAHTSRNPEILYTEVLLLCKLITTMFELEYIAPRIYQTTAKSTSDDIDIKTQKRKMIFYFFFSARFMFFEKIEKLLSSQHYLNAVQEKFPGGLKLILEKLLWIMEESFRMNLRDLFHFSHSLVQSPS